MMNVFKLELPKSVSDMLPDTSNLPVNCGSVSNRTSAVGTVIAESAKENFELTREWVQDGTAMVRDTLKRRENPAHYAFAASDLVMETATKTPAYLTKYAQWAWGTNVSLWGALMGKDASEVQAGIDAAAETVAETVSDVAAPVKAEIAPQTDETVAPKLVDDVTLIDGIGPVIAKKLADHGITSLTEIAALTSEQVETIEAELAFKGRITRDEWVEQAAELISGKAPRAKIDRSKLN